jgi:hypothetical protein
MIEMSQLTVLIMIEVIVGLAIACGFLAYFATTRKERIRKAAQHLAERVQSDQPARTKRLKGLLSEQYGYADNELEQILHKITQAEMRLFENLINGYIKDDQVHLQQIDVDEENLVLAYQELKPGQAGSVRPETAGEGSGEEELQQLQDENNRLSDELRVTMDTMGRMLNEYSSLFAGGEDKPLTREAAVAPADEAPVEVEETVPETAPGDDEIEVDIPDLQASDVAVEPMPMDPDELLESDAETASALDEEVSEIIDEVMEMADDINQDEKAETAPEEPTADIGESLMDELEQVDIELPETAQDKVPDASESEAAALEEEWAKLLEDEADSKAKSDDKSS